MVRIQDETPRMDKTTDNFVESKESSTSRLNLEIKLQLFIINIDKMEGLFSVRKLRIMSFSQS